MQTYDIVFEKCSMGYGDTAVLKDIEAHLPAGKISVILGGSGSGKSTLLRHLVGLAKPLSGKILIGGADFFALPTKEFRQLRRSMGMLFQDGALLGALTLLNNVALPLRERAQQAKIDIEEAALHTLRLVGLEDAAHLYPGQLSGGMRKRAGLARAIITNPPILLCDEPTSGLDPLTAAQMDKLLLSMKEHFPHMTMAVVSHDLDSLRCIADHVLVLHEGAVCFCGSLEELLRTQDVYLRAFLERNAGKSPPLPPVHEKEVGREEKNVSSVND